MYDFRTLSPIDFEELVRDLLQAELRIRIESFGPGRDQGIDFRFAIGVKTTIVQAKHYVDTGFSGLLAASKKENAKIKALHADRYIFATSLPLTPAQKSRIQQAMPDAPLSTKGILGKSDLNNLLGRHNDHRVELNSLETTFERMLDMMGLGVSAPNRPPAFRRSLKELEGSILAIENRLVRFSNPGVRDFLDRVVEDDRLVPLAIRTLTDYDELNQCWELIEKGKTGTVRKDQFRLDWIDAVGRVVSGSSGTALNCLKLALDSYARFPSPDLLKHIVTAAVTLEQNTAYESELPTCEAALEVLAAVGLPPAEADETRKILTAFTIEALKGGAWALSLDEVESAANSLLEFGSKNSEIQPAIHEALEAQIEHIDEMIEGIETLDDLHDFERDLIATFTKYGYKKKDYEYDIERRRVRIIEGGIHPRSARYGSVQRHTSTEATNEEIESMFRGLAK